MVGCPGEVAIILPMLVCGQPRPTLIDSGCSVTLIKASGIPRGHGTIGGRGAVLETMNGQHIRTCGVVRLASVRCGDLELGPFNAHVVSTLPRGVEMVIGLPLLLDHGCWFGRVNGRPIARWGAPGITT